MMLLKEMENNKFGLKDLLPYCVLIFINIAVIFCSYYYPTTRDDFYYLRHDFMSVFSEYKQAYLVGNPRIGQFFTNLVMRNSLYKTVYGLLLFNSFFLMVFLNVFRRLPRLKSVNDMTRLIALISCFAFLIFVFGEMFFYSSFSGNYTLSVVFYLLALFIFSDYYIFNKNWLVAKNWLIVPFVFVGIYTGMCNEHVPPVIIAVSFLASGTYLFMNKKLPNWRILAYQFSFIFGYLLLFFAPANTVKYEAVGRTSKGFSVADYFSNFKNVLNFYRYFTPELSVVFLLVLVGIIFLFVKKRITKQNFVLILSFVLCGALTIPIVSYAPLSGTRLVFFSNVMFFLVIMFFVFRTEVFFKVKSLFAFLTCTFAIVYFAIGMKLIKEANDNFVKIFTEIKSKREFSSQVKVEKSFYYFNDDFGNINRRFFLDKGDQYIDSIPQTDTSQEYILKNYFNLKSIATDSKNEEKAHN